jgi:hypothetical protein
VWFPERTAGRAPYRLARQICAACPVRTECAEYAIARPELTEGMFGGLTPHERTVERGKRRHGQREGVVA